MGGPSEKNRKKALGKIIKIAIPTVITVGLCFILFNGIDFREMMEIIRRDCDFRWIGLMFVIAFCSHVIRAWRWKLQLNALAVYPPFFWVVLAIFGTYAVNLVFPRLGEVWRTGYISERQHAQFTTVFGSMVADRAADTLTVLILAAITFVFASPALIAFLERYPETYQGVVHALESPWLWASIVALIICVAFVYLKFSHHRVIRKIKEALIDLWKGFAVVFRMKGQVLWLLLTVGIWGCYFFQLYVAFFAFPFTTQIVHDHGMLAVLVTFVLSSLAMGIPSNGGIGPWQIAVIFALTIYAPIGLTAADQELYRTNITAFANLVMGMETLFLIVLGIFTFICIFFDKRRHPKNELISRPS